MLRLRKSMSLSNQIKSNHQIKSNPNKSNQIKSLGLEKTCKFLLLYQLCPSEHHWWKIGTAVRSSEVYLSHPPPPCIGSADLSRASHHSALSKGWASTFPTPQRCKRYNLNLALSFSMSDMEASASQHCFGRWHSGSNCSALLKILQLKINCVQQAKIWVLSYCAVNQYKLFFRVQN